MNNDIDDARRKIKLLLEQKQVIEDEIQKIVATVFPADTRGVKRILREKFKLEV